MGKNSGIEWTDATFNPWWGCSKVSPACDNCYAEEFSRRFGPECFGANPRRTFGDSHWNEPRKWNRTAIMTANRFKVFSGSMCDVFEDRPELQDARLRLFRLIDETPRLDWLLLTKRPENIARMMPPLVTQYVPEAGAMSYQEGIRPNVWLGVTVENQAAADARIPHLLRTPASVRFLSCEPLLGPIDLRRVGKTTRGADYDAIYGYWTTYQYKARTSAECSLGVCAASHFPDGTKVPSLDWVIAGGESGPGARPSHPDWFRGLRDQCQAAGVPFFFKQWGEWAPAFAFASFSQWVNKAKSWFSGWKDNSAYCMDKLGRQCRIGADFMRARDENTFPVEVFRHVGKKAAGCLLDGVEHKACPPRP